ncbi:MAG: hypothetical protein K2K53_06925 [Oscillospiraceae bacterium]|nr:hypothetical protein [Oscillospiraceae bacterium]
MNPTKRLLVSFLALCLAVSFAVPAFASEIEPITVITDDFRATLSIDFSGQASCDVKANANSISYKIEAVMSLYQLGNPVPLKSWSANGTGKLSMSQQYYVSHGYDYQVTATITVRDSEGRLKESITANSAIVHY